MQYSGSYLVVESMIRQNKVMLFELEHLVNSLQRRGLLTATEREALLQLAVKILPKTPANLIHRLRR
jgi:hypothetical protein